MGTGVTDIMSDNPMVINKEDCRVITDHLQDDISKTIFSNRILFSLTNDYGYLRNICLTIPETVDFCRWLDQHEKDGLVLFGAGQWGKWIKETFCNYEWCFFADNKISDTVVNGLNVFSCAELLSDNSEKAVVITSKYYWKEIYDQLVYGGINKNRIFPFGKIISEVESRIYFDLPQLKMLDMESFADVGGYNGDTTNAFIKWAKGRWVSRIFEPGGANRKKCRNNLTDYMDNIRIIPKGVWSFETTLFFDENGSESSITRDKGVKVEVTTLDKEYENDPVTFIKMDIEGAESEAIRGAKKIITKNKPKLAISVYHKDRDIIDIPKMILDYNPDYKFYLRHYSLAWFDTVLYAI